MDAPLTAVERLQALSLVSKVCSELDTHLGLSDKTLAEFIVDLAEGCKGDVSKFQSDLSENGADFPPPLCAALLRLVEDMSPRLQRSRKAAADKAAAAKAAAAAALLLD